MGESDLREKFKGLNVEEEPSNRERISTTIKKQAEAVMKACEIEQGVPEMAPKRGSVNRKGELELLTNVHGIKMNEKALVHRYSVTIFGVYVKRDGSENKVNLTKEQPGGDVIMMDHRSRCRDVFLELKKGAFRDKRCVYYDLKSILFSIDDLGAKLEQEVVLPPSDKPDFRRFARYTVLITKDHNSSSLRLGDLMGLSQNLDITDRSIAQFLDISTSQYAMFNPQEHVTLSSGSSFLMDPIQHGFKSSDTATFPDIQAYLAVGATKSTKFIEGPLPDGRTTGLVVQTKKTPFHFDNTSLIVKASSFVGQKVDLHRFREEDCVRLEKFLKGLWVETSHGDKPQRFPIKAVSKASAVTKTITVGDKEMTVEQYFKQKYNKVLECPHFPLIETGDKDNMSSFPMEMCKVSDNQRVKSEQQTPLMTSASIKKCAVPPAILFEQNKNTMKSLHLEDNEYLKELDIAVMMDPMKLRAHKIDAPSLEYAGGKVMKMTDRFSWMGDKFVSPSSCQTWVAFAFLEHQHKRDLPMDLFKSFLDRYVAECHRRGLVGIGKPENYDSLDIFQANYKNIDEQFKIAQDKGCQFVFVVHADNDDDTHFDVKYAERRYSIVTQELRLRTLRSIVIENKHLTLQNIVNKTNVKFGGLNYSIALNGPAAQEVLDGDTLFIGIASSHPGGGVKAETIDEIGRAKAGNGGKVEYPSPTAVGFSANIGLNGRYAPFDFIGDFVFQEPLREEKIDVCAQIIEHCVKFYKQGRGDKLPKRVVIYRSGCSEGQFSMVLEYEIPLIRYVLKRSGCEAALTVIAVNKLQDVRFFVDTGRQIENVTPGIVIDHTVVHPVFCEFFLNSHRAIQGTARTPKYTVLLDESKMELAKIERITYHLCFGHQIVFSPTSLPSPVYIANRYAERGRRLYLRWMTHDGSKSANYDEIGAALSYANDENLNYLRVNA